MRPILALFIIITLLLSTACSKQEQKVTDSSIQNNKHVMEKEISTVTDDDHVGHKDIEIGQTILNGMEINAVYLPMMIKVAPIERGGQNGNIHLEADIHATKENSFGFHEGEWIPYLTIKYEIRNLDTNEKVNGQLYQMVAGDPHYASNVLIPKSGDYELTYEISPPDLARHEEDVKGFYEPMTLKWKFKFETNK